MFSRVLAAVLLTGTGFTALCQSPPKQQLAQLTQVPDYILYDAFFFRVNWLNDLADKLDAKGQNGAWARSQIARQARLTSLEQLNLNTIAADYRTTNSVILGSIASLGAAGASTSNTPRLKDLQSQRKQNVLDHIAQLQTIFGDLDFRQFQAYVHGTTGVKALAQPTGTPAQQPGKEPL
jgi:hypothetical protein